jgi:hypothetical protein
MNIIQSMLIKRSYFILDIIKNILNEDPSYNKRENTV